MPAPPARWDRVTAGPHSAVWVDGTLYEITTTLTGLLDALASDSYAWEILPGMLATDEQTAAWLAALFDPTGPFDLPDAAAITEAVIADLTGLPAHTAISLARWITSDWLLVDGYHLGNGTDLLTYPPRRFFAALYAFVLEHRFEDRAEADRALFPPTAAPPTAADLQDDAANFEAALALAGTLPGTQ